MVSIFIYQKKMNSQLLSEIKNYKFINYSDSFHEYFINAPSKITLINNRFWLKEFPILKVISPYQRHGNKELKIYLKQNGFKNISNNNTQILITKMLSF